MGPRNLLASSEIASYRISYEVRHISGAWSWLAMRIAYLLPDTNLFIQCKQLSELDWSPWDAYDEIHIVVTRPVQQEIDKHKNQGNARVAKRARKASSLLKRVILNDYELVDNVRQTIKISLEIQHVPSEKLKDRLNYEQKDDVLVGTVYAFATQQNEDSDVWLVTGDLGPLASAKMVDVPSFRIPDDWLLDPESSAEGKRIAQLEEKIRSLEHLDPKIVLFGLDHDGNEIDRGGVVELRRTQWLPLTDEELSDLISEIKDRFPMATKFDTAKTPDLALIEQEINLKTKYVPAKQEDIEKYQQKDYPSWIGDCEALLRNDHEFLQKKERFPTCTFLGRNDGSRPAEGVLVTIETTGAFYLAEPDQANPKKKNGEKAEFQPPPEPPKGRWTLQPSANPFKDLPDSLLRDLAGIGSRESLMRHAFGNDSSWLNVPPNIGPIQTDPNAFYWKERKPWKKRLVLECEQWRHGEGSDEYFEVAIISQSGESPGGLIECKIQATNATTTVVCRLPVSLEQEETSMFAKAKELVNGLVAE